jgi:excisionase family DNA binding protein
VRAVSSGRAAKRPSGGVPTGERAQGHSEPQRGLCLLTAQQLAERWQVPTGHVYRLTRRGEIPTVRLGRYCRYRLDAIEAWEEGQADD